MLLNATCDPSTSTPSPGKPLPPTEWTGATPYTKEAAQPTKPTYKNVMPDELPAIAVLIVANDV